MERDSAPITGCNSAHRRALCCSDSSQGLVSFSSSGKSRSELCSCAAFECVSEAKPLNLNILSIRAGTGIRLKGVYSAMASKKDENKTRPINKTHSELRPTKKNPHHQTSILSRTFLYAYFVPSALAGL